MAIESGKLDILVINGETGLRVPMHDQAVIVVAIERLRTDDSLRATLCVAAREHFASNHGWQQQPDRLDDM